MELTQPIRRGICEMKGTAYVGNKIVCEADFDGTNCTQGLVIGACCFAPSMKWF
ncbi:MAG: hypothetical protein IPO02_13795 [Bacteroidetes bacterium]|nr:hypothetical protein [Bacteroidota bacterium]